MLCLDVADLTEPELRREVLKLRRRVQKLTALLRLVLALRTSGFSLTGERLPDGRAKMRILRAVEGAREFLPVASGPAVPAGVASRCATPSDRTPVVLGGRGHRAGG